MVVIKIKVVDIKMDSVMLLPAEKENGHVNPSRITMLLSRLQFGAKMNVLMGLMLS